jgi:hypothetical protein
MVADSFGNAANGAAAMESPNNGGNNQQWRLNDVGGGRFQIVNRGTGTALDSAGVNTVGAPTVMWAPNASPNNHWTITAV